MTPPTESLQNFCWPQPGTAGRHQRICIEYCFCNTTVSTLPFCGAVTVVGAGSNSNSARRTEVYAHTPAIRVPGRDEADLS